MLGTQQQMGAACCPLPSRQDMALQQSLSVAHEDDEELVSCCCTAMETHSLASLWAKLWTALWSSSIQLHSIHGWGNGTCSRYHAIWHLTSNGTGFLFVLFVAVMLAIYHLLMILNTACLASQLKWLKTVQSKGHNVFQHLQEILSLEHWILGYDCRKFAKIYGILAPTNLWTLNTRSRLRMQDFFVSQNAFKIFFLEEQIGFREGKQFKKLVPTVSKAYFSLTLILNLEKVLNYSVLYFPLLYSQIV